MNFKGFLKKTGFLNEDGGDETAKVSFIRNAYRKSYPNSDATALNRKPEELWNAVLKKASYKLTKNSKEGTKKAVQFAKGARTQGTQRFQLKDKYETGKDTVQQNILDHLEDWDEKDFEKIKDQLPETFKGRGFEELKKIIKSALSYTPGEKIKKSMDDLFELIKSQESDEGLVEKAWKDKTIEDLDSLDDNDFKKIQTELNKIPGFENVTDLKSLKEAMENKELSQEQIDALDKLLEPEKTPANQDPPAETGRPETANRDQQRQMEEMEKKRKLEKKLKDNDIPVKEDGTPDFDNPKTLEKINELMINGDDELYKEYILAKGGNQSDLAKQIAQDTAKENELIRTDIENRTARREAEKDQQKAICNIALALDVIFSFLAGKTQDGFSTLANKRVQAKALETQLKTAFNDDTKFQETQKEIETAHNAELENITKKEKQRLSEIERDRQTPRGTPAYKKKAMELSQERDKKRDEWKKRKDAYMPKVDRQGKIKDYLFTLDTSTPIDTNNPVLKELIPQNDGESPEAYAARLQTETSDPVKLKEKLQAESDEIQQTVENFNAEEKQIETDYQKALNDLESDPEVQAEFKDANAAYEFKKANIQAEMNVLRAKEEKRYKDRISVNKQIFEEREKLLKNVATLSQWSSDPKEVMRTEFLNFNRKAKSMYESRGLTFNEDNDPALSDNDKVLKEYFDNFEKNMSDRIKQQQQAQQAQQGKGKKDDETRGKKPQRPPFGGHKPEPDPDPDKKKTKPGDGKKQLESLKGKFVGKPLASQRLDAFLKKKGLDPEEPDYDTKLQDAIKEFNSKTFPKPDELSEDKLTELGLTSENIPDDAKDESDKKITSLDAYVKYLKNPENADKLKQLKKNLGFDDDSTGIANKTPLKINNLSASSFDEIKGYLPDDLTLKIDGNNVTLSDQNWEQFKNKPEVTEYLNKNPEVLKKLSNGKTNDEKSVIDKLADGDNDISNKLSDRSLKSLWNTLNSKGISIRALPDYESGWTDDQKKNAIKEYLLKNKSFFGLTDLITDSVNLKHRKTAFKRLNEMSQAQKRASDHRTLRKFSELLVKDFRDFT